MLRKVGTSGRARTSANVAEERVSGREHPVVVDHSDLYSAVLTTAPFILLAVSGGIVFGPVPTRSRHRAWRLSRWALVNDIVSVLLVVLAAGACLLVLAGWVEDSSSTRMVVVWSGGLALFMLMLHVLADVAEVHRAGRGDTARAGGGNAATPDH